MNEERDKFLTETMGACWHRFDVEKPTMTYSLLAYVCEKCGLFILGNNDFSNDEDFPKLWAWARDRSFLDSLVKAYAGSDGKGPSESAMRDAFADEVYAVLRR
jgi:hypothetical protein